MHAFRIGKLFGIEIRIDWSWLFIFVLLTWNLFVVFSGWHPHWPQFEQLSVALVASLIFFGCILLHELAHSFVARRKGLQVRSITLFLFGGVSNIEHEPPSAKAEFLIAIAGPITSILLGVGFLAVTVASTGVSFADGETATAAYAKLGPGQTLLAWLGPINLVIGLFNLLPAFPLDGGRVLRAILWGLSGDLRQSTRRVSAIGRLFGWMLIVMGIAMTFGVHIVFFGTGFASGLWLAFIGWFLHSAASQSYKRLAVDDAFAGHTVQEIMRRDGPTLSPDTSLEVLVHDYLIRSDELAFPVVSNGQLVGVISAAEVRGVPPAEWRATTVGKVMRADKRSAVAPDEPLAHAFDELARQNLEQVPVLDHGHLVGMLRRGDVARWLELGWSHAAQYTGRP
jgi:Zn-dependent protease/CBS domain-containing protein